MQPEYIAVGDLFSRETLFTVPLFQRPYVWDEERWELLWEDVRRVADDLLTQQANPARHFLGSVVVQQRPTTVAQVPRREVIDGQQRLTTIQVLIKACADLLESDPVTADAGMGLLSLTRHRFAPKSDYEGSYKIWPTNADRPSFRAVMDGEAPNGKGSLFHDGYRYFQEQAASWLKAGEDSAVTRNQKSEGLARVLRQHLWLVVLNLSESDQAQVIFETLNARGTPLTAGDLIKNLILRRAQEEGEPVAVLYEDYWRTFDEDKFWEQKVGSGFSARPRLDFVLQQALTIKTRKAVTLSQVYDAFSTYMIKTRGQITPTQHLRDLWHIAGISRRIFEAEDTDADRTVVAAARIQAMDFSTAIPVLVKLLDDGRFTSADRSQAAMWLESYLVRRTVCGLGSNMYGLFFVDLMNTIENASSVSEVMSAKLLSEKSDSTRWPLDEEFEHKFCSVPVYKTLKRSRLLMILRALEGALRNPSLTDPVPIPANMQIEHIMPQQWQLWWPLHDQDGTAAITRDRTIQTIGNLTLVKAKLNLKLSNAPWNTGDGNCKRAAMQDHALLRLNTMLLSKEDWTEAHIGERSKQLFGFAKRTWPHPSSQI